MGCDGILKLLDINNKNIVELRKEFIYNVDILYQGIINYDEIENQLKISSSPFAIKIEDSKSFKLYKTKKYYDFVFPATLIALNIKPESFKNPDDTRKIIRKCKEIYENIVKSNTNTLNEEAGVIKRKDEINKSVKKVTVFIDNFLFCFGCLI